MYKKMFQSGLVPVIMLSSLVCLQACKAKKLPPKPAQPTETNNTPPPPPVQQPRQQSVMAQTPPPPAPKPDYNFNNIQFEFNSAVLKTSSYPVLDHIAAQMKMDPSIRFILKGYASHEGTIQHNLELSQDRANSVKTYLLNDGVSSADLDTKGYGVKNPVASNSTEAGRELNRRVEVHKE